MTQTNPPPAMELRALLEKATPGEWVVLRGLSGSRPVSLLSPVKSLFGRRENVELAVAAVNALPAHLDRIAELERELVNEKCRTTTLLSDVRLLEDPEWRARWQASMDASAARLDAHALLEGAAK
jgi:hypothetical protein